MCKPIIAALARFVPHRASEKGEQLARASLPPGFPVTNIDDIPCWGGGLFDNTPIWALLDLLDEGEIENLPIFVIELFPTRDPIPHNPKEVIERMIEISYENRFWTQHRGVEGLSIFTDMLAAIEHGPTRRRRSEIDGTVPPPSTPASS